MSLEELTGALMGEAEVEAEAILEDARARAAALERRASAEQSARRERELAVWRASCEDSARRELAEVAGRLRQEVLRTRARALERVREAVAARLPRLLAEPAVADAVVDHAAIVAGERGCTARCHPSLVDRARERVGFEVRADPRVGSGIVIELEGGAAEVAVILEGILERQWPALQIEALALIDDERDAS